MIVLFFPDKHGVIPNVLSMFSGVLEVIKRGSWPVSGSGSPRVLTSYTQDCKSLPDNFSVNEKTCLIAESLNYILACYQSEYKTLIQLPVIANTVKNVSFCQHLAQSMCSMPDINDSFVYDTVCNNSYICVMLSPKHILAMCFMQDPDIMKLSPPCQSDETRSLPENFSETSSTGNILQKDAKKPYKHVIQPSIENEKSNQVKDASKESSTESTTGSVSKPSTANVNEKKEKHTKKILPGKQDQHADSGLVPEVKVTQPQKDSKHKNKPVKEDLNLVKEGNLNETIPHSDSSVLEEKKFSDTTNGNIDIIVDGSSTITESNGISSSSSPSPTTTTTTTTTLPPIIETKHTSHSHSNKESVIVRLSNKIKVCYF